MFGIVIGNGTRAYLRALCFRTDRDAGCVRRHAKPTRVRRAYLEASAEEHEYAMRLAARRDVRHGKYA